MLFRSEYGLLPYHSYFLNVITKKNNEIFTIVDRNFDLEKISNKIIPFLNIDSCNVKIKGDRARRIDKTQFEWLRESTLKHNFGFSNQMYKLDKHYIKIYSQDLSNEDYYIIAREQDRMDLLAADFYGNSSLWWVIAMANDLPGDSVFPPLGFQLRIPSNSDRATNEFDRLNSNR